MTARIVYKLLAKVFVPRFSIAPMVLISHARRTGRPLDTNSEVIRRIIKTPAHTLEGLRFNAEICEREDFHTDLMETIITDLVAMGGANA